MECIKIYLQFNSFTALQMSFPTGCIRITFEKKYCLDLESLKMTNLKNEKFYNLKIPIKKKTSMASKNNFVDIKYLHRFIGMGHIT